MSDRRRSSRRPTVAALEKRLGALGNDAQDLIAHACTTFGSAAASLESRDYASFVKLMRDTAETHRLVAELYEKMARECERVTEKPS